MLPNSFYQQPTLELARALLGQTLVRNYQGERLSGRIVEVEAYHQHQDEAAHSFGGPTPRNRIMFGPPGFLYVYFIYGMHYCMNVVSEAEGVGAAVLIRAIEPLEGLSTMQRLRGPKIKTSQLTNGPAKCCQALAINGEHDGLDLQGSGLFIEVGDPPASPEIAVSGRIGISKSVDLDWRFYIKDNPYVSKGPIKGGTRP